MHWQDLVFTIGNFAFFLALIPSIRSKDKPAFKSSVMSAFFLLLFIFSFASLGLWFSAFGTSLTMIGWIILAYQKHSQNK